MNRNTILDYLPLINHQIMVNKALLEYHKCADAMLKVFLKSNIRGKAVPIIHDYLWGVSENISQANRLSERLLNDLRQILKRADLSKQRPKGD